MRNEISEKYQEPPTFLLEDSLASFMSYKLKDNRFLKSKLLIVISLLLVCWRSSSMPADKLYDLLSKQVVLVETFNDLQQPKTQGSAVVLGNSLCTNFMHAMGVDYREADKEGTDFLSNYHVIAFAARITVQSKKGEKFLAAVVFADAERDLAIIRSVKRMSLDPVSISLSSRVGQKVVALGAPKGLGWSLSDGIVSSFREHNGNHLLQMTAPISPGSSGGGLFDEDGHLIGITTAQLKSGQNLNFARAFQTNEIAEFRQLRRGHAVRPLGLDDDEWAVGQIKRPPMSDGIWRNLSPQWVTWNQYQTKLLILDEPREAKSAKEFLESNFKIIQARSTIRDYFKAQRSISFPMDVEGRLAVIELEESEVKKQALLDEVVSEFPDNLKVRLFLIQRLMARDQAAALRVIATAVEELPPSDATEILSLRLGLYVDNLKSKFEFLLHFVPAGQGEAIEANFKAKGW